jgi:hypothetical protein
VDSLETELERARALDTAEIADAIQEIGFECTRCGACCTAEADDPHTATVFPDEVREIQSALEGDEERDNGNRDDESRTHEYDWRDVARPMPYGLSDGGDSPDGEDDPDGENDPEGETFEWALATDDCGDCTFYEESADGTGACSVHEDRPLVCQTYPFSVALGGTSQPMGEAVDEEGVVRAHECEGLGRDISRGDAETMAAALKERAIREIEEAIGVRDNYAPTDAEGVVVHDSEGAKRPDGTHLESNR